MAEVAAPVANVTPPPVDTGDEALDAMLDEAWEGMPDRPDHIVRGAQRALRYAEESGNETGRAYALGYLGYGHYLRSEHELAMEVLTEALAQIEPLGDVYGRGLLLGALAGVHVSLGHFEEALKTSLAAISAARALGDTEREAWTLSGLGNSYLELGDLDRAMQVGEDALRLFGKMEHLGGQARAHGVIGGALMRLGRIDEARAHHNAALRLSRESGVQLNEARALHDLGECAHARGEFDDALALHREALAIRRAIGNRQAESTSLIHGGRALTELGRSDEAIETLHQAREIASGVGAEPRVAQADEALADAYEASGDATRALEHFRLYHARSEAMLDAQSRSRIHSVQVRTEAEQAQKEAEIAHLRSVELAEALTDLQQTQRRLLQQERLASMGRLASGVAHELQNPLNFVANFASINADYAAEMRETVEARRSEMPSDLADELSDLLSDIATNGGRVREHAERASGIVRSLIQHGQPASGERQRLDLRETVGRIVRVTFAGSNIRPVWVPGAEPVYVYGDAQALDRALVNLVDNARRAVTDRIEADGDFRAVVCLSLDCVDGNALLRVMDNGSGIPEELRERVFEPFFSTRPTGEGTGLGLPLARQIIVDGHEGDLDLEPADVGATFTIRLPLAPDEG